MSRHAQRCRHVGTGLTAADLEQLLGLLGADEHGRLLLPFMVTADPPAHEPQPSKLHAVQHFRPMLACLGSSAPVSQYLRPAVSHLVDRMLQVRHASLLLPAQQLTVPSEVSSMMLACTQDVCTVQDEHIGLLSQQDLQRCSPVLHGFLRDHLHSAALPASVKDLLRAMLQVRIR